MNGEKSVEEGRYLYCIANSDAEKQFGPIGVENSNVHAIAINGLSAVAHDCQAKAYETPSKEKAGEWILAHQSVIDWATEEFGTVVPLTFDTILKGNDEAVRQWLSTEHPQLKDLLAKLEGKAEFGVQVFLETDVVEKLVQGNNEVQNLQRNVENASSGVAYLLQKKLESRKHLEKHLIVEKQAKEISAMVKPLADEMKLVSTCVDVPEKWRGKQMLLNMSCLVRKDNVEGLGSKLSQIKDEGYSVRFTGPWPPYSFVGHLEESR